MNRIEAFEASLHGSQRAQGLLLRRYGIAPTERNLSMLSTYAARVRRSRWWGVVGVLVAAGLGWLGPSEDAGGWTLARLFAGYLIGSGVAEFASPRLEPSGSTHVASLSPRVPASLLPTWARVLPWVCLVPCLAAPVLILGDHPAGVTRFRDRSGRALATAAWFSPAVLITTALLALAALVLWQLTLHALAARPLPLDREDEARVDLLTRALSARAVSGSAGALGLSLLGGLGYLSAEPLVSEVCLSVGDCHPVYTWHDNVGLFQDVGGLMIVAAILLFWFSRLPRVDQHLLRVVVPVS
jgi:hypothetical protein